MTVFTAASCPSRSVSIARYAALLLVCWALCGVVLAEAAFYLVKGGCTGEAGRWTFKVESAADNAAGALYLRQQKVPFAGLAGSVVGRDYFWDDGTPVTWRPANFTPPTFASGFLTLVSDGGWSYRPFDVYPSTLFLCADAKPAAVSASSSRDSFTHSSSSSSSSTAASVDVASSHSVPIAVPDSSSESASQTTDTPPPRLDDVVAALGHALDAAGTIAVAAHTANAVQVPSQRSAAAQLRRLLASDNYSVFVGMGNCGGDATHVATLMPAHDDAGLSFVLPLGLVHTNAQAGAEYDMCVRGYEEGVLRAHVALRARLRVEPIARLLSHTRGTIHVTEEELVEGAAHTKVLQLTGRGTLAPFTYFIAPAALATLRFSLVNNGLVAARCVMSNLAVDFAVADDRVHLYPTLDTLARATVGAKSLCASLEGTSTGVVVAQLVLTPFTARAAIEHATYNTPFALDVAPALSATALAKGHYSAFLAESAACDGEDAGRVLLEVSSGVTAHAPHAFLTAMSDEPVPPTRFACLRHDASGRTFVVRDAQGRPLRVTAPSPDTATARTPRVLTLFTNTTGHVYLMPYLLPPTPGRQDEATHAAHVRRLLEQASPYMVRLVPVHPPPHHTPLTELQEACVYGVEEVTLRADRPGRLHVHHPLTLVAREGVMCVGTTYIRVHYRVRSASSHITSLAGMREFDRTALVAPAGRGDGTVGRHAATITFAEPHDHDLAIGFARVGATDCTNLEAVVRVRDYDEDDAVALSTRGVLAFPAGLYGSYALCLGTCGGAADCALAPSGRSVTLTPYDLAWRRWREEEGLDVAQWVPCAAQGLCEAVRIAGHTQAAVRVCTHATSQHAQNGVRHVWPPRLADAVMALGSVPVVMAGNAAVARGAVMWGGGDAKAAVYVAAEDAAPHCQELALLAMTTDGVTYGTSVVVVRAGVVRFDESARVPAGVALRLVPWDGDCAKANRSSGLAVVTAVGAGGESTSVGFDTAPLLVRGDEGYYAVCAAAASTAVRGSYVHVAKSPLAVQIEGIATASPVLDQAGMTLWETQIAHWDLSGVFAPHLAVRLQLRWNDPTCDGAGDGRVGLEAVVRYVSRTGARVTVDTADLVRSVTKTEQDCLYACSVVAPHFTAQPLPFEQHRHRCIRLRAVQLSSINYLQHYAIAANVTTPTRLRLTDPHQPPLTSLAVFRSATAQAVTDCALRSDAFVTTVRVQRDSRGVAYVELDQDLVNALGAADEVVYLALCATAAAPDAAPRYQRVQAYLTITAHGMGADPQALLLLRLYFAAMNASTDVLEPSAAARAVTAYALAVLPEMGEAQMQTTDQGPNCVAVFIEPGRDAAQTRALYRALITGQRLPLHVRGAPDGPVFVLSAVEGVYLDTQERAVDYPYTTLRLYDSDTLDGDVTGMAIRLFCIVTVPTAIGIIAFSLQRTIPRLTRAKSTTAQRGSAADTVVVDGDDSPPPRDPARRGRETRSDDNPATGHTDGFLVAAQTAEAGVGDAPDTAGGAAGALHDVEDEFHAGDVMGCSPPLRNTTFAMERMQLATSAQSASHDVNALP